MYLGALNASPRELPSGYTQLEYIQSTGTQHIDTGVIGKSGLTVRLKFSFSTIAGDGHIMTASSNWSKDFSICKSSKNKFAYAYNGQYIPSALDIVANRVYDLTYNGLVGSQSLVVDGNTVLTGTDSASFNSGYSIFLPGANLSGNASEIAPIKIYLCQIYDNGTLVRDYVPCKNSAGTVGLYDMANGQFHTNAGTGTFTAGATIKGVARKFESLYFGAMNAVPRELPSGYTQVEYIQSTGTQYIDTGVEGKSGLSVHLKFSVTNLDGNLHIMTATVGWTKNFSICMNSGNTFSYAYNGSFYPSGFNVTANTVYDLTYNANVGSQSLVVDGNTVLTGTDSTSFNTGLSLFLPGANNSGTVFEIAPIKIYLCQIYDNGTLVRDYVPCKNASGTVGLYDLANGKFYENAGTGTFTVGSTTISSYARTIAKGYIGVNGVAKLFYQNRKPMAISSLPVGSLINLNESGVGVNFYLAKHNYESGLNGNGRTLMVRKDLHSLGAWGNCPTGGYNNDNNYTGAISATDGVMNYWFNNTYIKTLDSAVQTMIGKTKFYINHVYYSGSTLKKGVVTMQYPVFALSLAEYGYTSVGNTYAEGSALDIASTLRIAKLNGTANEHWTRSAYHNDNQYAAILSATGATGSRNAIVTTLAAYRPVFTLPATAKVWDKPNADGSYTLIV